MDGGEHRSQRTESMTTKQKITAAIRRERRAIMKLTYLYGKPGSSGGQIVMKIRERCEEAK